MAACMGLLRMRTAAFVARPAVRRFSTSVAVTTPAGARTVAVVPGNTSSPALALATMPLTIASNNMPLLMMASRWGLAIGIFLYALIRPNEWDRQDFWTRRFPHVPRENSVDPKTHKVVYDMST